VTLKLAVSRSRPSVPYGANLLLLTLLLTCCYDVSDFQPWQMKRCRDWFTSLLSGVRGSKSHETDSVNEAGHHNVQQ